MADNVAFTPGTGATGATDDIGGVHYPRVKIGLGADGTANDAVAGAGAVGTGVQRVTLASDDPAVTAVQLIDDAIVADDAAFTPGTTKVMMAGAQFDDSTPDSVNEGDAGAVRMSANRNLYVNIRDAAGNERGLAIDASGQIGVVIDPTTVNANGREAAADSAPVVLSTEDKTALDAAVTALQLIDDAIVADDAAFTPATTKVMMAGFQADEASIDSVNEGDAGAARMTLDRKQIVTMQPHTAGGMLLFRSLDLDETEEEVKATAGCLFALELVNRTTSVRYVKLYNATAANVTVGTTTPIATYALPAALTSDVLIVMKNFGGLGLTFDTALSIACTTGFADNDTGAPGANDVIAHAYYL